MATILTVEIKGVSRPELEKNFQIVDSYMSQQKIFELISNIRPNYNPRIYYNQKTINSKDIHDIITVLKTDKVICHAIRSIEYAGHLNKV